MKNLNKYLALLALLLFTTKVNAQDIIINATTSKVTIFNGGKLHLNGDNSKFRSTSADTSFFVNEGQIHFKGTNNTFTDEVGTGNDGSLGSTAALRVPGTIYYSDKNTSNPQVIQSRWYASLTMDSAATKTITDAVYVGSTYNVTGQSGDRSYTGNFYYDGILAQPIFGEDGTSGPTSNAYANLVFQNAGVKTLATGSTANADNFTTEASATGGVVIEGTMSIAQATTLVSASPLAITDGTFNTGAGASDLSGTVTISGATQGTLVTNGAGLVTINGTTNVASGGKLDIVDGDVTIADGATLALADAASAELSVGESRTMTVTGTFSNAHALSTNMTFFDNATDNSTNSTVIYNGTSTQSVVATVETNPYSNLQLEGSAKTAPADGIVLAGNFSLADGNLDMKSSSDAILRMTDDAAAANYGGSEYEVIGKMRRDVGSSTDFLTFNNDSTRLAISNPANVDYFTLDVTPNYTATGEWDYEADNDILRRINYDYQATGTDWAAEMQYGFKQNEAPTGKWSDAAFLNTLRMREILSTTESEKVSTGVQPDRNDGLNTADNFRAITLATIRGTGGAVSPQSALAEVTDNAGLFLRGGPALFISVRPGRWSNPATWDEGEQPGATDRAAIRHNVHIGFTSTVDNYSIDEDVVIDEKGGGTYTNKSTIAAEILINDKFGESLASDVATLIVGSTDLVGLTDLTSSPLSSLIQKHGQITVKEATGTEGTMTQAQMDNFKTSYSSATLSTAINNLGLVVVPGSSFTATNGFDAQGLVFNGGLINVGEED